MAWQDCADVYRFLHALQVNTASGPTPAVRDAVKQFARERPAAHFNMHAFTCALVIALVCCQPPSICIEPEKIWVTSCVWVTAMCHAMARATSHFWPSSGRLLHACAHSTSHKLVLVNSYDWLSAEPAVPLCTPNLCRSVQQQER